MSEVKDKSKKLRTTFAAIYTDVLESPAWREMTPVMRNAHLEMKAIYNRNTEGPVFMSERKLAKLINVARETASIALAGLEHYGFIRKVRGGYLGADGCGLATEWRMTDERYLGESATLDFKRWAGVVLVPPAKKKKQKPGLKTSPVLDQKLVHPGLEISPGPKKTRKNGAFAKSVPGLKTSPHLEVYPSPPPERGCGVVVEAERPMFGVGHNRGPKLDEQADDLSIPEFLKRNGRAA
jgi:hypothetical protein